MGGGIAEDSPSLSQAGVVGDGNPGRRGRQWEEDDEIWDEDVTGKLEDDVEEEEELQQHQQQKEKEKVVVVMGATGSGKSRLAIDLASHFPMEIVNADSMQVYGGLDVLTNKVPVHDRRGVPHHLLGTVDSSVDFTSKDFRDLAVPVIDDILSRKRLPVVVGGTNFYIQALVSPFLVDDFVEDMDACCSDAFLGSLQPNFKAGWSNNDLSTAFDRLKELDPASANRIHPNDHRKINHYLNLYASSGVLPSELFQGKALERWGRAENAKYDCCFIWVDASLPLLDRYVEQRVDCMMEAGLLNEVCDIYNPNADYTRGLRQAIGVREFGEFFNNYLFNEKAGYQSIEKNDSDLNDFNREAGISMSTDKTDQELKPNLREILHSDDNKLRVLLNEAIGQLKANTRRLVRRQKRRLNRLKTFFGWDLHYIDATGAFLGNSGDSWQTEVVEPCIALVKTFLCKERSSLTGSELSRATNQSLASRDLWTQHICEACGNRILRGAHEWEQHKQGRGHRKRVLGLKNKSLSLTEQQQHFTAK